jgi:hypothetical protein
MFEGYDVAQVCLNGHMINDACNNFPQHSKKRCPACGEETIMTCPTCTAPIQGHYYINRVSSVHKKIAHQCCHQCGRPYPWTERRREAALELFIETLDIEEEQRGELKRNLEAISTENPRTQVAAVKVNRLIGKAGKEAAGMLRDVLLDLVSETAKKVIWPGS